MRSRLELPDEILAHFPVQAKACITREAREWTPAPRPKGVRKRADRACFLNSARLACAREDLTYCEGFALTDWGWVHHAWCVTPTGVVVDSTWPTIGMRYIGFTVEKVEIAELVLAAHVWGGVAEPH